MSESRTQDFLYEFAKRNYEKEEQGSDVAMRTLPFFATSLGALLAALAVMRDRIVGLPPDRLATALWLLGAVLALAILTICCIAVAILGTANPRLPRQ